LFDRVGARPLVIPGAIGLAASMWILAFLGSGAALWAVIAAHVLLMASLGLMMTPLFTEGLSVLPAHLYSHGSAIMATLQQVAGAAGTAGFVTVAAVGSASAGGTPDAAGLQLAFMAAGVIGLVTVGVSFLIRRRPAGAGAPGVPGAGDGGPDGQDAPDGLDRTTSPVARH
jgi:DHA2 family lincomycin resistance protein-like MFS transporter